ncbi:hypothetical protein F4680DRAFT_444339 [Xylaria scruposa]|nr:hypothetical protein F4680DRAFT_444339 [Xylaria scruposa]
MPVARIPGSSQYVELMQSLATSPIKTMPDGSRRPPESWARKLVFLPATPEIAILANMVSQLRREAEAVLRQRVKGVAIASPDGVSLTRYEIRDILDYLRMEDLIADKQNVMFDQLFSLAATSAGYGDGLCASYTDAYECEKEQLSFLNLWALHLDFSYHSFTGAMDWTSKARRLMAHDYFVDLELGERHRPLGDVSKEQKHWDRVGMRIRQFANSKRRVERLYLTGDSASEPRFLEAVTTALVDFALPSVLETLEYTSSNASAKHYLFATSKGAAEFAKRRQEGMALCQLPEKCAGTKYSENVRDNREL